MTNQLGDIFATSTASRWGGRNLVLSRSQALSSMRRREVGADGASIKFYV